MVTAVIEKKRQLPLERRKCAPTVAEVVEGSGRDYWDSTGQIFLTDNHGWGLAPDLSSVCLGTEFEIQLYLKGGMLPKHINPVAGEVLEQIKELKVKGDLENARTRDVPVKSSRTQRAIRTSSVRVRPTSHVEYKPLDTRQFKARQRISGSKA